MKEKKEEHQTWKDVSKGQNEPRLENEHGTQNERGEEKRAIDGDGGINTMRLALLNENPISKRLTEFMGKKSKQKREAKIGQRAENTHTDELWWKSIANPEGPERDNDLQLPAALFPISDKRKKRGWE